MPLPSENNLKKVVKSCHYFSDFAEEDLKYILRYVSLKKFVKNDVIFLEGDDATAIFYVCNGIVKVFKTAVSGKEVILHLFKAGESFAEIPVFLNVPAYPASAMCVENSELLVIQGNRFRELIHNNPDICLKMLAGLSKKIKNFNALVEDLTLRSVESRLAKYILSLRENCDKDCVKMTVNKKTLAAILGTVPETLSRTFKKLEEENLVSSQENQLTILDEYGLYALADMPESCLGQMIV